MYHDIHSTFPTEPLFSVCTFLLDVRGFIFPLHFSVYGQRERFVYDNLRMIHRCLYVIVAHLPNDQWKMYRIRNKSGLEFCIISRAFPNTTGIY